MIRPTISQLRMEHIPGLQQLFQVCQMDYATTWEYNPELSLVALHDEEVVGFVAGWHSGQPYGFIDNLLVLPKYKHQGIGTWLARTMWEVLKSRGAKCVRVVLDNKDLVPTLIKGGMTELGQFTVLEKHNIGEE